jgi:hypothetical protein
LASASAWVVVVPDATTLTVPAMPGWMTQMYGSEPAAVNWTVAVESGQRRPVLRNPLPAYVPVRFAMPGGGGTVPVRPVTGHSSGGVPAGPLPNVTLCGSSDSIVHLMLSPTRIVTSPGR